MNVGAKESVPYFDGYTRKAGEELHESCLFCFARLRVILKGFLLPTLSDFVEFQMFDDLMISRSFAVFGGGNRQ